MPDYKITVDETRKTQSVYIVPAEDEDAALEELLGDYEIRVLAVPTFTLEISVDGTSTVKEASRVELDVMDLLADVTGLVDRLDDALRTESNRQRLNQHCVELYSKAEKAERNLTRLYEATTMDWPAELADQVVAALDAFTERLLRHLFHGELPPEYVKSRKAKRHPAA